MAIPFTKGDTIKIKTGPTTSATAKAHKGEVARITDSGNTNEHGRFYSTSFPDCHGVYDFEMELVVKRNFQVGDTIRNIDHPALNAGKIGTITESTGAGSHIYVRYDDGNRGHGSANKYELMVGKSANVPSTNVPSTNWTHTAGTGAGISYTVGWGQDYGSTTVNLPTVNDQHGMYYYNVGPGQIYPITKPKKTIMRTLGTMMKKLLDPETQTLVKAGFVNGDLELTSLGQSELIAILFSANKTELVKVAQERLDADKE